MKKALILIDIQNDFLPNGSLPVPKSDEIIPFVSRLLQMPFDLRIASMDWHPAQHCSFASTWNKKVGDTILVAGKNQILWPDHCLQGSFGAALSQIDNEHFDFIVYKGTDRDDDSYSAFFDNNERKSTGLKEFLKKNQIEELYFAGLATEYCVYYSVMDALELGFRVAVISDACRGIEVSPGDIQRVCHDMKEKGAQFMTTEEALQKI